MKIAVLFLACCLASNPLLDANTQTKVITPSDDVPVPEAIQNKLSAAANVRAFLQLPNGDSVAVYDTVRDKQDTADFMDNEPRIAFLRNGALILETDSMARTGPVRFHGLAVIPVPKNEFVIGFAFTLGVDGAETFFLLMGPEGKKYKEISTLEGAQAQLRFSTGRLGYVELWQANGQASKNPDEQCVWCRQYYKISRYSLSETELKQVGVSKSKQPYSPELFSEAPFKEMPTIHSHS